jgi:Protein of unknown function (DUF732)
MAIGSGLGAGMSAGVIWPAFRRSASVGAAVLAVAALAATPGANADPPPGCFKGTGPQSTPGCAVRAYEADIAAAGLKDSKGNIIAADQGLDLCTIMDGGISPQVMANQFLGDNPALGPNGATQVVSIAIKDLCPWHS